MNIVEEITFYRSLLVFFNTACERVTPNINETRDYPLSWGKIL